MCIRDRSSTAFVIEYVMPLCIVPCITVIIISIPLYLSVAIILAISTVRILSVIPPDIT